MHIASDITLVLTMSNIEFNILATSDTLKLKVKKPKNYMGAVEFFKPGCFQSTS